MATRSKGNTSGLPDQDNHPLAKMVKSCMSVISWQPDKLAIHRLKLQSVDTQHISSDNKGHAKPWSAASIFINSGINPYISGPGSNYMH